MFSRVEKCQISASQKPSSLISLVEINWSVESRGTAMFSGTQHRTSLKQCVGGAFGPRHGSYLLATNTIHIQCGIFTVYVILLFTSLYFLSRLLVLSGSETFEATI